MALIEVNDVVYSIELNSKISRITIKVAGHLDEVRLYVDSSNLPFNEIYTKIPEVCEFLKTIN